MFHGCVTMQRTLCAALGHWAAQGNSAVKASLRRQDLDPQFGIEHTTLPLDVQL